LNYLSLKSKKTYFFIFLIIILILNYSNTIIAFKYDVGFKKNDEFVWNCNVCNENKMEQLFGKEWKKLGDGLFEDIKQNTRMKWEIEDIKEIEIYNNQSGEKESAFKIEYKVWRWTENENWDTKSITQSQFAYEDPSNYESDYIYPNFAPIWLPIPVGEYMKALEGQLYEGYTVDGRVLLTITCELNKGDLDGKYPTEYIKVLAMYNGQGLLRSYKLYIKNHVVILDISLTTNILAEIPIAMIFSTLLIIGTIYVLFKKLD